jgi:hypothetical protein
LNATGSKAGCSAVTRHRPSNPCNSSECLTDLAARAGRVADLGGLVDAAQDPRPPGDRLPQPGPRVGARADPGTVALGEAIGERDCPVFAPRASTGVVATRSSGKSEFPSLVERRPLVVQGPDTPRGGGAGGPPPPRWCRAYCQSGDHRFAVCDLVGRGDVRRCCRRPCACGARLQSSPA